MMWALLKQTVWRQPSIALVCVLSLLWGTVPAHCLAQTVAPDYTVLSLEELMEIEITSVAKKMQKRTEAAAAVSVITQEDIRRAGVTSLPEALRLAPGVEVARIDANKWAISIRGFHSLFANKLLVLLDGRSVYSPLFSGVFWDVQDIFLEDVERIEVIRGPGATLWGANAVNGIVNIITKSAQDTQGGLVSAGGGTEERAFGGVRYGMQVGEHAYLRAYGKGGLRDGLVDTQGQETPDGWDMSRGGLRLDWQATPQQIVMLQGELYGGHLNERRQVALLQPPFQVVAQNPTDLFGGHLLARWQYTVADGVLSTLQLYYDRTERQSALLSERRNTVDVDVQQQFALGTRQALVVGLGYRWTGDDTRGSTAVAFDPDSRSLQLFNAFVQDDITLVPARLRLTLGTKVEHDDTVGFTVQPSARLLWTPQVQHTVWAAFSRAVRTPARVDEDFRLRLATLPPHIPGNPGPLPLSLTLRGQRDVRPEVVLAYEGGYRLRPVPSLAFDLAAFYNVYSQLITFEPTTPVLERTPAGGPVLTVPLRFANRQRGLTWGVELATDWQPLPGWRLHMLYTYFDARLRLAPDSRDPLAPKQSAANPRHQVALRSAWDLPWQLSFDVWLRYVDALPSLDVRSYTTFDARLAWRPVRQMEVSLVGQNLPNGRGSEFVQNGVIASMIQRGVYGKVTWNF